MGKPWEYKRNFGEKFSYFGTDTNGHDVKVFGDTTAKYIEWDASADTFNIVGTLAMTGNPTITGDLTVTGTSDLGTSAEADAYTVGGVAGIDFSGAVTTVTVVKGIVTAAA